MEDRVDLSESDRQLLAPLVAKRDGFAFGRSGGSPTDIAELDRSAVRLLELQRDG
jgi:hypothetical protein